VTRKKDKTWVEVTMAGEQKGYITGDTKIFAFKKAQLMSNSVDVHETADENSPVIKTLTKGTIVTVSGVENLETGNWFKIQDDAEMVGYIPTQGSKLRVVPELSRSSAIRNMATGAIFTVIGIVLTLMNSSSANQNTMIYISYAVIFFGLLQLGQGAVEMYKVTRAKNKPGSK
jgi:uncharacterized protein YgiM (DUF1202 family)